MDSDSEVEAAEVGSAGPRRHLDLGRRDGFGDHCRSSFVSLSALCSHAIAEPEGWFGGERREVGVAQGEQREEARREVHLVRSLELV